jgi:hypothetical protein
MPRTFQKPQAIENHLLNQITSLVDPIVLKSLFIPIDLWQRTTSVSASPENRKTRAQSAFQQLLNNFALLGHPLCQ